MKTDPDAVLLSHFRQRRLDAEVVRDSMLVVSGRLNQRMSGPSIYPPIPASVLEGQSKPGDGWGKSDDWQACRRSIYIFAKRSIAPPELELLDSPDTTSSCEQRLVSTTGPQALTFLNGDFIRQHARFFAARLCADTGSDKQQQIRRAFELAFCREATAEEMRAVMKFLADQRQTIEEEARRTQAKAADSDRKALEAFCLVLLNANEFFYRN